ncbi:MAG TPA: diacylglycerol kinase family protein [Bacteroidota bacterium]|nr:diacylglycerol kinase family protein [Bacteroidota bacterium]
MSKIPLFVINPAAGGGKASFRWKKLRKELDAGNVKFKHKFTSRAGEAQSVALTAVREGFKTIVAFGGDGTLNEVLNGIIGSSGQANDVALGFLGAGSSNDFAKIFKKEEGGFIERLIVGKHFSADVAKLECVDANGVSHSRYFLAHSNTGIISNAIKCFNEPTLTNTFAKRVNIDFAVVTSGLRAIRKGAHVHCDLILDGERFDKLELSNLAIMKNPNFGGGMFYNFESRHDDGLFHVVAVGQMTKFEMLKTITRFYDGTIMQHPKVWYRTARTVEVISDLRYVIETDGELVGCVPARYTLLPKAINILV